MKYKIYAYPQIPLIQEHLDVLVKSNLKLNVSCANGLVVIIIDDYISELPLTKAELITIAHNLFPDKNLRPKIMADYIGPGLNIPVTVVYDDV